MAMDQLEATADDTQAQATVGPTRSFVDLVSTAVRAVPAVRSGRPEHGA